MYKKSVLIVTCIHGDEQILKNKHLKEIGVETLIANHEALKENKRFIDVDLNRSFGVDVKKPLKYEEVLAKKILLEIKNYDLVIDIHSTKSDIKELVIVSNLNKKTMEVLKFVPIKNVVLMKADMCKGSLIKHCKIGISLEYNKKTKPDYVIAQIKKIIGQKKEYQHQFFKVKGEYSVKNNFKPNFKLKELHKIKKGTILGNNEIGNELSKEEFYPLFLGKGRYEKTACLMLKKIEE